MNLIKQITKFGTILLAIASLAACSPQINSSSQPISDTSPIAKKANTLAPKKTRKSVIPYPLYICLVSNEPLDEWDDMQTIVYKGQEMNFCCSMCLKKFKKEPQKYLKLLEKITRNLKR